MIHKSYTYMLYPNKKQQSDIFRQIGAVRFLWNQLTANFNSYGTEEYKKTYSEKEAKQEHPWLEEIPYTILQQKRRDFFQTASRWFRKPGKKGRPNFKKKTHGGSFRVPAAHLGTKSFKDGIIKLPKIDPIKIVMDRPVEGRIINVTVVATNSGEFYVRVLTEQKHPEPLTKTGKDVGVDLGLTHMAILSDGTKIENPRWFMSAENKIKSAQKHLSRKTKGSKRYEKQRIKLSKVHAKVSRKRDFNLHKVSNFLISNYDSIFIEDLNVAGIKKKFGKSASDVSWANLVFKLQYKADWYGKEVLKIDRWFASSKTCSVCNTKNNDLKLKDRIWECSHCKTTHDRDLNAAKNILDKGLETYYGVIKTLSAATVDYGRGEDIRLKTSCGEQTSEKRLVDSLRGAGNCQ